MAKAKGKGGRPPVLWGRKKTRDEQLNPADCKHRSSHTDTNRKGQRFKECDTCGAFLGYT